LQGAAAEAEETGSFVQTEIATAQALANEAEDALREIGLRGIRREKLVGCGSEHLMRNGIGATHWQIEQGAIEEQRSDRHVETHRRAENAGVLGDVLGFRVCEPDFARLPCGAFRKTVEARDRGHGHLDIVASFRERAVRIFPLEMRDGWLDLEFECANVRPDGQIAFQAAERFAKCCAADDGIPDDAVGVLFDVLAYMKTERNVSGHARGELGKHHHVRIRNSEERVAERVAVEADGFEQMAGVAVGRDGVSDLAHGTSENCGRFRNGAAPWLGPDESRDHVARIIWRNQS
jgi:hypothetical protein